MCDSFILDSIFVPSLTSTIKCLNKNERFLLTWSHKTQLSGQWNLQNILESRSGKSSHFIDRSVKSSKHFIVEVREGPTDWVKNDKPASRAWVGQWKPAPQPSAAPRASGQVFTDPPSLCWQVYTSPMPVIYLKQCWHRLFRHRAICEFDWIHPGK